MQLRVPKMSTALVLLLALLVSTCTTEPITSFNRFLIDNQSSTDLFYNTGAGLDERTIEIPRLAVIEIEVVAYDGDKAQLITADEFFIETEDDIYLLKVVDGNFVEALQLNTTGLLNWEIEMVNGFTYSHVLMVTDELLN